MADVASRGTTTPSSHDVAAVAGAGTAEPSLPVIDVSPLLSTAATSAEVAAVANAINAACRAHGFFYVTGYGDELEACARRLDTVSRAFFALPEAEKREIDMARGGKAWRGFFPVCGEQTSGRPDVKEGIYLGTEDGESPLPLHGPNLWPQRPAELRELATQYVAETTRVGHALMRGIALSLNLDANYFHDRYTATPTILFRIFNYPTTTTTTPADGAEASSGSEDGPKWGVGAHTDYGLLTLLRQDDCGGLQVRTGPSTWIDVTPLPNTLVINIGDMLQRMTRGYLKSTLHRVVRNTTGRDRLSFPLFFDPAFNVHVQPIPHADMMRAPGFGADLAGGTVDRDDSAERWDGLNLHHPSFHTTYGEYLITKVSKVFPTLKEAVLT